MGSITKKFWRELAQKVLLVNDRSVQSHWTLWDGSVKLNLYHQCCSSEQQRDGSRSWKEWVSWSWEQPGNWRNYRSVRLLSLLVYLQLQLNYHYDKHSVTLSIMMNITLINYYFNYRILSFPNTLLVFSPKLMWYRLNNRSFMFGVVYFHRKKWK